MKGILERKLQRAHPPQILVLIMNRRNQQRREKGVWLARRKDDAFQQCALLPLGLRLAIRSVGSRCLAESPLALSTTFHHHMNAKKILRDSVHSDKCHIS
jgi:hypothetical protein